MISEVWKQRWLELRWMLTRFLKSRHTVCSRGLRFSLPCDNWITFLRCATYNTKEPETLDWIDNWMRDGDTLLDVGANIGVYSIYAALRHPSSRVIALEPEYSNLHLLRDSIVLNNLQERVEVYSVALGNNSGLSYLHLQDFTPGAARHLESMGRPEKTRMGQPVVGREGIAVFTLDEFCDKTGIRVNCMKIDVDGTEPEILEGAMRTLRSPSLSSLIIELPSSPSAREQCESLLTVAGFTLEWCDAPDRCANEVWVRRSTKEAMLPADAKVVPGAV